METRRLHDAYIEALEEYREACIEEARARLVYDPCGDAARYAERKVKEAVAELDAAFAALVNRFSDYGKPILRGPG